MMVVALRKSILRLSARNGDLHKFSAGRFTIATNSPPTCSLPFLITSFCAIASRTVPSSALHLHRAIIHCTHLWRRTPRVCSAPWLG